jgi:hypothetical protein
MKYTIQHLGLPGSPPLTAQMFIAEAAALSDLQPPIARENYPLDPATSLARGFQWTGRGGKMIRKPWKNRSWVQNHGFW